MSFIKNSSSAFGKLLIVIALATAFLGGMASVVYMSLQGEEMKVPEIVGKDFAESEKEIAQLGLKIKERAKRYSTEKPNTILEQLPKAGDTVKTGQMILVVTSKTNPEGEEAPVTIKKNTEDEDDSEEIEELISDKPKKSGTSNQNANSNKKKGSTTRDVIKDKSNSNTNLSNSNNSVNKNSNSSDNSDSNKSNKNSSTNTNTKPTNPTNSNKPNSNKTVTGAEAQPRKTPSP
ncbi:MAG: PASTA domain-containing protein [Acidobacteria bacterium]|nr:PASTA domain-containing protein [Acidobacteriota bacterium]MCA1639366.1 PASTA domain-containing protein [Acidobacteriota bacterium]